MTPRSFAAIVMTLAFACRQAQPVPARLDPKTDACAFCRMAVSDQRYAAQIVAHGEEPRFFDDLGCLGHYVEGRKDLPLDAVLYVADHRTKAWVRADRAVYTQVAALETPMSSHIIAHAEAASRDLDPDARGGRPVTVGELFHAATLPGSRP
jgi:copper chaperone NosL